MQRVQQVHGGADHPETQQKQQQQEREDEVNY